MLDSIRAILDRAAADREFLRRLARDPIGAAYAEGYAISSQELKEILGLGHLSDEEAVATLQVRVSERARPDSTPGH